MATWGTAGISLKGPKGDPGEDYDPAALDAKADDSAVVHNTGSESIQGYKLFTQGIGVASPSQSNSAVRNDDSRLTNSRTPTAHKATHATGGSDALSPADIGAATVDHTHGSSTPYALSYGSTITPNCNNGSDQRVTLTGSPTIALATNPTDGQYLLLWFYASGADRTVTFNSSYEVSQPVPGRVFTVASGTWGLVKLKRRSTTWVLVAAYPQSVATACVFQGRSSSAQSIANNVYAPVLLPVEDFDTDGAHSTASNTSRFTCVRPGIYTMDGSVVWPSSATGVRAAQFNKNGTMIPGSYYQKVASTGPPIIIQPLSVFVTLAAGDYVEMASTHNAGGNQSTQSDTVYTSMMRVQSIVLF